MVKKNSKSIILIVLVLISFLAVGSVAAHPGHAGGHDPEEVTSSDVGGGGSPSYSSGSSGGSNSYSGSSGGSSNFNSQGTNSGDATDKAQNSKL